MSLDKFVTVDMQHGPVRGDRRTTSLGNDYINFQGIPYMRAPQGQLKFRAPVEPEKWTEPFDATRDCPAYPDFDFATNKFVGTLDAGCVNVFTKNVKPTSLYPVMVYIHGGGFQTGSSSPNDVYNPTYLLQKDIIFASFNYRCGVLGFLSLDEPVLDVPGNAGLKDQTMALKWIKDNIRSFGGDPNNITVFGSSAGGSSVHYHLISEQSRGLFTRAIQMSGSALNMNWELHPRRNYGERIAKACGYKGDGSDGSVLEFLESADVKQMVIAAGSVLIDEEKYNEQILFTNGPVIEPYITSHTFIDKEPILMARNAWSRDIDVIIGGASNEGLLMGFFPDPEHKRIRALEDPANFTPFLALKLQPSDPKAQKVGKILKELYYGSATPSSGNMLPYFYYQGDLQFWHETHRSVMSRINASGKGRTFVYYFDIVTKQNVFKKLFHVDGYPGAEHGAGTLYLFKYTTAMVPTPAAGSIELSNVNKVVEIFTSFASSGDTGVTEWADNKVLEEPLKCLRLYKNGMEFIDLPQMDKLRVWDEIYEQAGAILY